MEPGWTIVAARHLSVGDTIGVDYEPGERTVDSAFFEGPDIVVLDLIRDGVRAAEWDLITTEWHLSADHEVLRAPRLQDR